MPSTPSPTQPRLEQLFEKYGESHRHPINVRIHAVCVPLITFSLLGLLWSLHPGAAVAFAAAALLYYLRLSPPHALAMLGLSAAMLAVLALTPLSRAALPIFVAAWIGQFIGHKIEGKKPSFLDDLTFLLVGPLWVLGHLVPALAGKAAARASE